MEIKKLAPWNWFKKEEEDAGKTVPVRHGEAREPDRSRHGSRHQLHREIDRVFDDVFRDLMARLEALGLLEETILVLASDHGEEFLEHGHISHCRGVWDTVTHVPLAFRIPGVDGRRLDTAVENVDIVPTLLDYLAIDTGAFGFEGRSLRPLVEVREGSNRFAIARQTEYRSADDGRMERIPARSLPTLRIHR